MPLKRGVSCEKHVTGVYYKRKCKIHLICNDFQPGVQSLGKLLISNVFLSAL